jgi:pentalenene synthase
MPQGVLLPIPFPSRISPDFDRVHAHHLDWPRSFGLLPTPEAEHRHLRGRYSELGARFHPSATGTDLDLGVDQQSWYFLFDDHFDGPTGRDPGYTRALTAALSATLAGPAGSIAANPPTADPPLVRAFADLWARSREGMSAAWVKRAADHWRAYFRGHVAEAVNRNRPMAPSFADQLELRVDTIGVAPVLDLAERIGHYEIPALAYRSPLVTSMHRIAHEVVILDNDIVSVEKEEGEGDCNLVLRLEQETGWSRTDTIHLIGEMIRQCCERFVLLERQLPELCRELGLDERQREILRLYQSNALRPMMRGAYDWDQQSGRYTTHEIAGGERHA